MNVLALLAMAAPVEDFDDGARTMATAEAGDLAAFESLMRQHERLVLVTAVRLLGKLEDAQDASQEVFLRLYRNLGKIDGMQNVPGWLYRVTVNVCHDMAPVGTGEKMSYIDTGISTDVVDVKEGQKLVVGRSSLNGPDTALFMVLIAKVAQ